MVAHRFSAILLTLSAIAGSAASQPLSIQIETSSGRSEFRIGEAIGLKLTCEPSTGTGAESGWMLMSLTSQGRTVLGLGRDRFVVTPAEGTRDPWDYRLHGGFAYSGIGGIRFDNKDARPVTLAFDLNQWVRFERPGHFTVRGVFHATGPGRQDAEIDSNAIVIDIVAADPEWQREELARDETVLSSMKGRPDSAAFEARMTAARGITFLDTPDAARAMARGLGTADIQTAQLFADGLRASSHAREAIAAMRELLASPSAPVPDIFLRTLAALDNTLKEPQNALAEVVERKQGEAKAVSLQTLIGDMPAASVSPKLRSEVAAAFPDLPAPEQLVMLRDRWTNIGSPEMISVLRQIYEAAPQSRYPENPLLAVAVERLYELDTARTRDLLLDEMKRRDPRLPYRTLALLPDATIPELDAVLLDHLRNGGGRPAEELISRYATASILDGAKEYYAKHDAEMRSRVTVNPNIAASACEPPLLAYFLRVDPAEGERLLRQTLAERSYALGRCWIGIIGQTAVYNAGPSWEKVAIDALQDGAVPVKIDAVESLSRYGSAAAKPAIFDAFRYWHEWWKEHGEPNDENRRLEQAFLQATTHPRAWTPAAEDTATVRDLCVTAGCKSQVPGR